MTNTHDDSLNLQVHRVRVTHEKLMFDNGSVVPIDFDPPRERWALIGVYQGKSEIMSVHDTQDEAISAVKYLSGIFEAATMPDGTIFQ